MPHCILSGYFLCFSGRIQFVFYWIFSTRFSVLKFSLLDVARSKVGTYLVLFFVSEPKTTSKRSACGRNIVLLLKTYFHNVSRFQTVEKTDCVQFSHIYNVLKSIHSSICDFVQFLSSNIFRYAEFVRKSISDDFGPFWTRGPILKFFFNLRFCSHQHSYWS